MASKILCVALVVFVITALSGIALKLEIVELIGEIGSLAMGTMLYQTISDGGKEDEI